MDTLHTFWFNNEHLWFASTPQDDKLITLQFSHLITNSPNIDQIISQSTSKELLCYILLYDQIIRHVYRNNNQKINELSRYSLQLSLHILSNNLDTLYLPQERCFILLPLRHTFDLQYLNIALNKIREYREQSDCNYYIRFYKATILSISKIKTPLIVPEEINESITNDQIFNKVDPNCIKNLLTINNINKAEPIYKAFETTFKKLLPLREITLSLSGGVDSMISSFILYHLSNKQQRFRIVAVTIDYGNREEYNEYEIEFVKRWCKLLEIPHYVKHITELKRDRSYDRDLYEKITRTLRFDMYKRFNNPIVFGHNLGDCLENIFNNIKKSRSLNNLRGMSEISMEDECCIVRPMLDISKADIRAFANRYRVPYLGNSTPTWSERGQVRDVLLPAINTFDGTLIPGFVKMADNMKQLYIIYETIILNNFYKSIIFTDYKVTINLTEAEKHYGFIFWKDILSRMLNELLKKSASNKSIEAFIIRIANNQYGKIKINKEITFEYTENKLILQLKEETHKEKTNYVRKINYILAIVLVILMAIYLLKR